MINFSTFGRWILGAVYFIFCYLNFAYTVVNVNTPSNAIESKAFWIYVVGVCWFIVGVSFITNISTKLSGLLSSAILILIFIFSILPNFNGMVSWMSTASLFAVIAGSLMVAGSSVKKCCSEN